MRRHGFGLVGVIFTLLVLLAGVGALSYLARQSGRASHWFHRGQAAQALAQAALTEGIATLERSNSATDGGPLAPFVAQLVAGSPTIDEVDLLVGGAGGMARMLERLLAEGFQVEVRCVVTGRDLGPLTAEAPGGLPVDPRERHGEVMVRATATVTGEDGLSLTRFAALAQRYKIVGHRPPLLGRFVLFVDERGPATLDGVEARVVRTPQGPGEVRGDGVLASGSRRPLVVIPGATASQFDPETRQVRRRSLADEAPPDLLDRQGWVYLGGDEPWTLSLAHGFGEVGESHLVSGGYVPAQFQGSPAADQAFRSRLDEAMNEISCDFEVDGPDLGLRYLHHGFARDFELVGIGSARTVQSPGGERIRYRVPGEEGRSSLLRLWGTPQEVSPTLVFGPVQRRLVRKAFVRARLSRCTFRGVHFLPIFLRGEDPDRASAIVEEAFGPELESEGSRVGLVEPYMLSAQVTLDTSAAGRINAVGTFVPSALAEGEAPPPSTRYRSELIPDLGELPAPDGLPPERLEPLFTGDLDVPALYSGRLADGLAAFGAALGRRVTYTLPDGPNRQQVLDRRVLRGGPGPRRLTVPGILYLPGEALELPPVQEVQEGGMLVVEGDVTLTGDLLRAGDELLTIVSLGGDIVIGDGVSRVEAGLVALDGTVRFPGRDCTIAGFLAARRLDLDGIQAQRLRLEYDPRFDPLTEDGDPYRVYFGDEGTPRFTIGGGAS